MITIPGRGTMSEICDIGIVHPESPSPPPAGGVRGAAAREIASDGRGLTDDRRALVATMARRAHRAAVAAAG